MGTFSTTDNLAVPGALSLFLPLSSSSSSVVKVDVFLLAAFHRLWEGFTIVLALHGSEKHTAVCCCVRIIYRGITAQNYLLGNLFCVKHFCCIIGHGYELQ